MVAPFARLGTDLRLLGDLERQNDRNRGSDLSVIARPETGQTNPVPKDLETLSTLDNLKQALLLRFLTPVGELTILGHPDYGSLLYTLIGELNNETTRNRAKMYVLQALAAEPRVKEVILVRVTQNQAIPEEMDIEIRLSPIDSDSIVNLVFPFFLDRGVTG